MAGKRVARSLLLVAGMLLAGCGGAEVEAEQSPSLETREDQIICDDYTTYNKWIYYSDATMTVRVGERSCECYGPSIWGYSTPFYRNISGSCE